MLFSQISLLPGFLPTSHNDSGPMNDVQALFLASVLASLFPLIPEYPGIQIEETLFLLSVAGTTNTLVHRVRLLIIHMFQLYIREVKKSPLFIICFDSTRLKR